MLLLPSAKFKIILVSTLSSTTEALKETISLPFNSLVIQELANTPYMAGMKREEGVWRNKLPLRNTL